MVSEEWQQQLRTRGYRLTPQRQLVLEAVAKLGHATPDAIATSVRQVAHSVNLSTVYRTLDLLEGLGLVIHTHLGHGAPTYHLASARGHVHLVCRACGALAEVPGEELAPLVDHLDSARGFLVDLGHLAVFGCCARCAEPEPEPGAEPEPEPRAALR